jgi:hypothetical protein
MAKKIFLMLGFLGMASMVRADMIGGMIPPGGGGGTPGTPVNSVQFNSAGSFTGDPNFNYSGSSLSILAPGGLGVTFGVTAGSVTAGNLVSGNCVQAAAGGALTTVAGACASTAGFASLSATQTFTGANTFQSSTTFTQNVIDIAPQGFTSTYVVSAGSVTASSATVGGQLTAGTFVGNGAAITAIAGPNITTVIPSGVLVSSVAYLSSTQTWTAGQTFTSSVTVVSGSSLTLNGLLVANGGQGTSGQVLQSNGSSVPSWATLASASLTSTQTWTAGQTFTSSVTVVTGSSLTLNGLLIANGAQGTSGQLLQSNGSATPSWATFTSASLTSTQTWSGANTYASSVAVNGGFYSFPVTINGTQAIFSTHTIVLASATPSGITLTLDASNAVDKGQILQISKVDTTTQTVTIKANGTDLIAGSTRTLVLNAIGQTDEIVADGNGNWWPHGQGLQISPPIIYPPYGTNTGTYLSATSSDIIICAFYLTVPVAITGYSYDDTITGSANIAFGVMDNVGNVLASTGPVAIPATGRQTLSQNPINIPSGSYNLAVQLSNVTARITGNGNGDAGVAACSIKAAAVMGIVNATLPGTAPTGNVPSVNILVGSGRQTYN